MSLFFLFGLILNMLYNGTGTVLEHLSEGLNRKKIQHATKKDTYTGDERCNFICKNRPLGTGTVPFLCGTEAYLLGWSRRQKKAAPAPAHEVQPFFCSLNFMKNVSLNFTFSS